MKKIILIGGGGHCKAVIEAIERGGEFRPCGIIDLPAKVGQSIVGTPIISDDRCLGLLLRKGISLAFITAGSVGNTALRKRLFRRAEKLGFSFPRIIHPGAIVSRYARLGSGVFVAEGAIINPDSLVGDQVIVNSGAIINHDCRIGDFAHIAPGAVLSGGVTVGGHTHIGSGACVLQGVRIGSRCMVGAGSVVLRDLPDNQIVGGNPCRRLKA